MGVPPKPPTIPPSTRKAIDEIMHLYRSLPPQPTSEEVVSAMAILSTSTSEEEKKLQDIATFPKPADLPEELFFVLQDAKKKSLLLHGAEQRREAHRVVRLDESFRMFDEPIQRLSKLVSNPEDDHHVIVEIVDFDKERLVPYLKTESFSTRSGEPEKLNLIKVASLIETSTKDGTGVLNLRGKLIDHIEFLPQSLGKLQELSELDLSENQIMVLPSTIGGLRFLTKLDVHSNQLENLPESFGDLFSLVNLDLHANKLKSLPASFGNLKSLVNLDISSNQLFSLPDTLGNLRKLRKLSAETNELEEFPYTIGSWSSLVELRLDFNHLKALLPEAIGKLESLEVLTIHYNRIKGLPTTMASLSKLRELDVSFNELESIPESLCFATNLVRLDVGRNFSDFRSLPRSIGNLENLEHLDISSNQIRVLPESFRFLSKLRVFNADETPLEVPPREVIRLGAKAVVEYMADLAAPMGHKSEPAERKCFCFWFCSLFRFQ